MSSPNAKPLDLAFSFSLENRLFFNLWIRANSLPTSEEDAIPSHSSFHQTLRVCQLPQFTFSLSLAFRNASRASRTAGSQRIFFWERFSKSGPFLKPAAGSSLSCSAFTWKTAVLDLDPAGDPPSRGKSVTSPLPLDPVAFLRAWLSSICRKAQTPASASPTDPQPDPGKPVSWSRSPRH